MKRFTYRQGIVLMVASGRGFGYIYALHHDPGFGSLFAVVHTAFDRALGPAELACLRECPFEPAYVNTAYGLNPPGGHYRWERAGQIRAEPGAPVFFYGSEYSVMTVRHFDGTEEHIGGPVDLVAFEDQMFSRGYYQRVLWHPESIAERIFLSRSLRWSEHKKY